MVSRSVAGREPVAGAAALFGALLLLSPTLYPWYLLWVLPWAALAGQRMCGDVEPPAADGRLEKLQQRTGHSRHRDVARGMAEPGLGDLDECVAVVAQALDEVHVAPHVVIEHGDVAGLVGDADTTRRRGGGRRSLERSRAAWAAVR